MIYFTFKFATVIMRLVFAFDEDEINVMVFISRLV